MYLKELAKDTGQKVEGIGDGWRRGLILVSIVACVLAVATVGRNHPSLGLALGAAVVLMVFGSILERLVPKEVHSRFGPTVPKWFKILVAAVLSIVAIGAAVFVFIVGHRDAGGVLVYAGAITGYVAIGVAVHRARLHSSRVRVGAALLGGACGIGVVSLAVATVNVSAPWLAGVAIAALVAPAGLSLLAEHWIPPANAFSFPELPWGVAAIAAGLALLSLAGVGRLQALLITLALFVLLATIVADNARDITLVVVAIALLWSLEPDPGRAQPDPAKGTDAAPRAAIFALGDSYMSGEGASVFYADTNHNEGKNGRNECRRAPTAYPVVAHKLLREEKHSYELFFIACSGARTAQLTTKAQYLNEPTAPWAKRDATTTRPQSQLQQARSVMKHFHLDPQIVLISIGGNDAGFGEIGQTCGLPGDCSVLGQAWLSHLSSPEIAPEDARSKIRAAYAQIRTTFPTSRVIVVPYPVPLNEAGCTASLLRPNEHRFLVGFTRALDQVIKNEAESVSLNGKPAPFEFVSPVVDAFTEAGVRICDKAPSHVAVNQVAASPVAGVFLQQVSPRGWFHSAFHPNKRGHARIGRVVADWIEDKPDTSWRDAPLDFRGIMGQGYAHCGSLDKSPATCHQNRVAWVTAATTRMLVTVAVPILLIVIGAWLVWVRAVRAWRA